MNQISPPDVLASTPVHVDTLRSVIQLPDTRIIAFVGRKDGEKLAAKIYGDEFRFLNAEVQQRAFARAAVSRFFVNLSRQRARRIARWFRHVGISETWENTRTDKRFRASFSERVAASGLALIGLAGIGVSINALVQYLQSGPLVSLANANWFGLAAYASVILFAALATKGMAMMLSREAQKRLGLFLGTAGLLGFLCWNLVAATIFQPLPEVAAAAPTLLSATPAGVANPGSSGSLGILLLAMHLASDWALGSTVFIAAGVVKAKGRVRHEARTSTDSLSSEMAQDVHREWEAQADILGTDLALSGEAYAAGLRRAELAGRAHYGRLLRRRDAAITFAEYAAMRSGESIEQASLLPEELQG